MKKDSNKTEPSKKTKVRKAKIAVVSLLAIVIVLLGLQVYASRNGYDNMFFMIKEWMTGNTSEKNNQLSDRLKEENEIKNISERELSKYLNIFSELNNGSGKEDTLLYIAKYLQDNYKDFMDAEDYQYRMDKSTDRAYKNAIIKEFYGNNAEFEYKNQADASKPKVEVLKGITGWEFDVKNDAYIELTAGEEYKHGKCLKIEEIKNEGDIYTIKYVYILYTGYDEDDNKLEELPQYETTIKVKRIEDNLYSKYQVVSIENGTELKDKVDMDDEENDDIFKNASTLKYTSNFKDSENGKIAVLKAGEKEFKTSQKDGYYTYTDIYGNSYDIKKIKSIDSKFEMTNKDNDIALFCCTINYLDNNDKSKSFDIAVTLSNNFEDATIHGTYLNYTGSTSFTRLFGVYDDENETNIEIEDTSDTSKWKQVWPEYIGMKFKVPNNFEITETGGTLERWYTICSGIRKI